MPDAGLALEPHLMSTGYLDRGEVARNSDLEALGVLEADHERAKVALDGAPGSGREDAHQAGIAAPGEDAAELLERLFGRPGAGRERVCAGDAEDSMVVEVERGVRSEERR